MSLHDRIINLPTDKRCPEDMPARLLYKQGHRDARHAASEMTLEADELIEECECALSDAVEIHGSMHALKVLNKIKKYRETTK